MKATKTDEEVTYLKKTTTHTFTINGKEVRVYDHYIDDKYGEYDVETNIDDRDFQNLTPEEQEFFGENDGELLALEVDEEYKE